MRKIRLDKIVHRLYFLLCCFFYFLLQVPEVSGSMIDRIVAIVNDEVITLSELQEEVLKEKESKDIEQEREALNNLIDKRLQLQKARQLGINVTQEEVLEAIEDIKKRNSIPDDQFLTKRLAEENTTIERYKEDVQNQLLLSKLFSREVNTNILIGEEEVERYYKEHEEDFIQPEEVRIRQILLKMPEKADSAEKERMIAIAEEVFGHLQSGEDFAEIARRYSQDPSAQRGGDLGFFRRGQMIQVLEEVIFSLKVGEISEPVLSPLGFHILKLEEKKGSSPLSITEVKEKIREILVEEKSERLYRDYLKNLRNKAYVDIRL